MAGEGQILREAREKKQLSLAEVEESTKIRIRYLQALENEEYSVLPGNAYVKGFLRTYAKFLGINPDEVVSLYMSSMILEQTPTLKAPLTPIRSKPIWLRPVVAIVMALLVIVVVIGIANWSQSNGQTNGGTDYTPPPMPNAPQVEPDTANTPGNTADTSTPVAPGPDSAAAAADGVNVKLVFTQDCWLEAQVDGKQVLKQTFRKGDSRELTAQDKIVLVSVGNAGGVNITLNGVTQQPLGKSWQVIKNVSITKEGMQVS